MATAALRARGGGAAPCGATVWARHSSAGMQQGASRCPNEGMHLQAGVMVLLCISDGGLLRCHAMRCGAGVWVLYDAPTAPRTRTLGWRR